MVIYCTIAMCYDMVVPWFTMVWYGLPCLHHGIARQTMFAGDLHTRTAVARLPLHQLEYLVAN